MAEPDDSRPDGAPSHIHIEKNKGFNWLPWLLLALGLLALLFALSRHNRDQPVAVAPAAAPVADAGSNEVVGATPTAGSSAALVGTSGLGTYLAGSDPLPRTFTFEKLNFDTAKSEIRAADAAEVNDVATTLAKYPTSRIRIAGYADARGNDAANMALGKARADSVRTALVAKGVDAGRVETVSGGETDPVDTNATPGGRFENRRTELVVTAANPFNPSVRSGVKTMSSTITAMFDSRAEAEAAKDRLKSAHVDADHVHVHDQSSSGYNPSGYSTHQDRGMWASIKNAFLPDEDRHTYEEGVRRGGAVLTADVDDDHLDEAVRVLEQAGSIDIDDRAGQWRSSGWNYPAGGAALGAFGAADTQRGFGTTDASSSEPYVTAGTTGTTDAFDTTRTAGTSGTEEVIPVVEEQLVVGKRDVNRGGVRVRSYVTETPVHEQIRLRNERVNVERRTVDQPLSAADTDAFRERTIDMTATGEEAVIGKTARVVEEVVVSKTAEEHVEDVADSVRRTDVEVDRDTDVETRTGTTLGTNDNRY